MTGRSKKLAFKALAGLGVALGLAGVTIDVYAALARLPIEAPHTLFWGAMLFGFIGFFGLNPDQAERGATVATTVVTRVLNALPRFGRRSTDAMAVPRTTTITKAEEAVPIGVDEDKDEAVERPKFSPGGA